MDSISDYDEPLPPRVPVSMKETEFTPPSTTTATTTTYELRSELFQDDDEGVSIYRVEVQVKLKKEKRSGEEPKSKKKKTNHGEAEGDDDHDAEIGYLFGTLIERPNSNFYGDADSISGELQELACQFCDRNGTADRLNNDELTAMAKRGGGFFHIYKVEVRRAHQGLDLGLRMMHEAFVMLDKKWTLAVLKTAVLENLCRWNENRRLNEEESKDAKNKHIDEACEKLKRYWSRMGFVQSGQTRSLHDSYFLCKDSYFKKTGAKTSIPSWKTKEEVKQLVIFTPERQPEITGLDLQLRQVVENAASDGMAGILMMRPSMPSQIPIQIPSQDSMLLQIRDLVHQGASIAKSNGLHIAAANGEMELLRYLLALLSPSGDDVNAKDHTGNTALHVAAARNKAKAVQCLIEFGAQKMITNEDGETPLKSLLNAEQSIADMQSCFGLPMGGTFPANSVRGKELADRQRIKSLLT